MINNSTLDSPGARAPDNSFLASKHSSNTDTTCEKRVFARFLTIVSSTIPAETLRESPIEANGKLTNGISSEHGRSNGKLFIDLFILINVCL